MKRQVATNRFSVSTVKDGEDGASTAVVVLTPSVIPIKVQSTYYKTTESQTFLIGVSLQVGNSYATITSITNTSISDISISNFVTENRIIIKILGNVLFSAAANSTITVTGVLSGVTYTAMATLQLYPNVMGSDAVEYRLECSTSTVVFEKGYSGTIIANPANYTLQLRKTEGSTSSVLSSLPSGYYLKYKEGDEGVWDDCGLAEYSALSELMEGALSKISYGLFCGTTLLQKITVTSQWNYNRMLLPSGTYIDKQYTRDDTSTPLVYYNGSYWYLVADNNVVSLANEAPSSQSTVWRQATEYEVVLTRMLFADFAQMGGFIVYGDYFFSRYGWLIPSSGDDITVDSTNVDDGITYGGKVPYGWFDSSHPMAETSPSTGYYFRPMKLVNAVTGEEWMAGGKVHVDSGGNMTIQNISVQNAFVSGSLMAYRVMTKSTAISSGTSLYTARLYDVPELSTTIKRLPFTLECDIFILTGPYDDQNHNNYSWYGHLIELPPASLFVGARIKIINGTYKQESGKAKENIPSIINLMVWHPDMPGGYTPEDYALYNPDGIDYRHENSGDGNIAMNSLHVPIPFEGCNANGDTVVYYYGDCEHIIYKDYESVELVATVNPFQGSYNPNFTNYNENNYVWMVIGMQKRTVQ